MSILSHRVRCVLLGLAFSTAVSGQAEKLPPILQPSDYAIDRAKAMGAEVFKLLPIEMNHPAMKGFNEGSMTLGELGTGNYYKFTRGANYPPLIQIGYSRGDLTVGGGFEYGFYTDLGERDLRDVDIALPETGDFLSYKPPNLEPDIVKEIERLNATTKAGSKITRRVAVKVGHTYLLRSIVFDWVDLVVALHVLEASPNGSITILWKKLAEFEIPPKLFMPDGELQKKIDAVLTDLQIQGLKITISNNCLLLTGANKNYEQLTAILRERGIPYRGIGNCGRSARVPPN